MKRILVAIIAGLSTIFCFSHGRPAPSTVQHPEWSRSAVIYEVNLRQYTDDGTFRAFLKELPRLKELGVDILWFMPVHPISKVNRKGVLGSYYAASDYKKINPEFGSISDFKDVVDEAHSLGMKVIIDWVPNHSGCDHIWVESHPEYYARDEKGNMYGPYDWDDVYKLDYNNPGLRIAMTDAMEFWLRETDIDGFRCDVAGQVPIDFWNTVRPQLELAAEKPIFMLAEDAQPIMTEHAFDADYNWPMSALFNQVAHTAGQRTFAVKSEMPEKHAADIDSLMRRQAATFPADSYLMNMTTNHDMNSWEGTEFERLGKFAPALAVLTYMMPGMPLIYTGQETGLNRAFEFFQKDAPPQWEPRNDYFTFYQRLNTLKHTRPELAAGIAGGSVHPVKVNNSNDMIAFKRELGKQGTFFAANLGAATLPFTPCKCVTVLTDRIDAITGNPVDIFPTQLAPGQFIVFTYNVPE